MVGPNVQTSSPQPMHAWFMFEIKICEIANHLNDFCKLPPKVAPWLRSTIGDVWPVPGLFWGVWSMQAALGCMQVHSLHFSLTDI